MCARPQGCFHRVRLINPEPAAFYNTMWIDLHNHQFQWQPCQAVQSHFMPQADIRTVRNITLMPTMPVCVAESVHLLRLSVGFIEQQAWAVGCAQIVYVACLSCRSRFLLERRM